MTADKATALELLAKEQRFRICILFILYFSLKDGLYKIA